LGHIILAKDVELNPEKVRAVKQYSVPKNYKEFKQFLEFIDYYRRFIKDLNSITNHSSIIYMTF